VKKRVKTFIQNLLKNHQDTDNILVITHGGWKNTFFSYLMDTPRKKAFYIKFANTSISEVEFDKNENHKIFKINCAEHLEKYE
jgi:broad specificity phosphatase PhoE